MEARNRFCSTPGIQDQQQQQLLLIQLLRVQELDTAPQCVDHQLSFFCLTQHCHVDKIRGIQREAVQQAKRRPDPGMQLDGCGAALEVENVGNQLIDGQSRHVAALTLTELHLRIMQQKCDN